MKTIIAGSRNIDNPLPHINDAVMLSGFRITEIVSGTARGIDQAVNNRVFQILCKAREVVSRSKFNGGPL